MKDKHRQNLKSFQDSLEGFELKYNIDGFLNKIDDILMNKYQIDKISRESRAFFSKNDEINESNQTLVEQKNIKLKRQAKSMFHEEQEIKPKLFNIGSSTLITNTLASDSSMKDQNLPKKMTDSKRDKFDLTKSLKDFEILEEIE